MQRFIYILKKYEANSNRAAVPPISPHQRFCPSVTSLSNYPLSKHYTHVLSDLGFKKLREDNSHFNSGR